MSSVELKRKFWRNSAGRQVLHELTMNGDYGFNPSKSHKCVPWFVHYILSLLKPCVRNRQNFRMLFAGYFLFFPQYAAAIRFVSSVRFKIRLSMNNNLHFCLSLTHSYYMTSEDLKPLHTESEIFACVFPFFSYSSAFPIKNVCYGCENTENWTWS